MKLITISRVGYNAPSGANWAYGIWKIDAIDTEQIYNMSYTVKETFGGDSRFRDILEKQNIIILETKGIYTGTGTQKITGIAKLQDIESKEFISEIVEWYNKK
jgi:hypothetical protein